MTVRVLVHGLPARNQIAERWPKFGAGKWSRSSSITISQRIWGRFTLIIGACFHPHRLRLVCAWAPSIHMRKPTHNALDRMLNDVSRRYISNPIGFGTSSTGRAVWPAWRNWHAQPVAIVPLQLVRKWLSGRREQLSSCQGVTFGFSCSTWNHVVTERRWVWKPRIQSSRSSNPSRSREEAAPSMSHNVSMVPVISSRDTGNVGRQRLRLWWPPGLFRYMLQTHDEEMSRMLQFGWLIDTAIGLIAGEMLQPPAERVHEVANSMLDQLPKVQVRAHRQNIVAALAAYCRCLLPPIALAFHGAEKCLGEGRVDLLWSNFVDEDLIDEVKTENIGTLDLLNTKDQIERYLRCALTVWGDLFVGIRVLSTSAPRASVFVSPARVRSPLVGTSLVREF
jgi:hypothetical protein